MMMSPQFSTHGALSVDHCNQAKPLSIHILELQFLGIRSMASLGFVAKKLMTRSCQRSLLGESVAKDSLSGIRKFVTLSAGFTTCAYTLGSGADTSVLLDSFQPGHALNPVSSLFSMMATTSMLAFPPILQMNRNARKPKKANGGSRPCSSVNRRKRRGRLKGRNGKIQR